MGCEEKNTKNNHVLPSGNGTPDSLKYILEVKRMKKLCRLLEFKRRLFIKDYHKQFINRIPAVQFEHLMNVRQLLPCNLTTIMDFTGLSSAGASIFVTKLVDTGVFVRCEDPDDRRNMIIDISPEGRKLINEIEKMLSEYIANFYRTADAEDIITIDEGCRAMLRVLDKNTPTQVNK